MGYDHDDWGLADDLREELRAERAAEDARQRGTEEQRETAARSMMEWTQLVPEPKFGVLDFDLFPYQREWYSDEIASARQVVWQKSTQVGMSAYAWRWAARRSDQFGDTAIYVFPADKHVTEFGDERIEPAIEQSDYLLTRIPDGSVRNKHQKRIGGGWLYLRGSSSRVGAQSVAGDALVFDEYDELDVANLAQMERRLSGAKAAGRQPRLRRLGVPTLEGYGIAAAFDRSDQRRWYVTCDACGLDQALTWEDNVRWISEPDGMVCRAGQDDYQDIEDVEHAWRVCKECEEPIDVARGRWVVGKPGARTIGYHVSRLIVPGTDLEEIVRNSRKTSTHDIEAFHNNDLGIPYSSAESGLSEEDVWAACSMGEPAVRGYDGPNPVTAGLDVAGERVMHIRISELLPNGRRRGLYAGLVTDFNEAKLLMDRFRIRLLAVDSMPERRAARDLARDFPGRVILARYDDSNPEADPITIDDLRQLVTVHRTEAIDGMMDGIRAGRNVPPRIPPPGYVKQMIALKRKVVEDAKGRPRRVYVKTGGHGDDYAHAEVFDLVAKEVFVMKMAAAAAEEAATTPVTDEELGLERLGLALTDDFSAVIDVPYEPGFGGDF